MIHMLCSMNGKGAHKLIRIQHSCVENGIEQQQQRQYHTHIQRDENESESESEKDDGRVTHTWGNVLRTCVYVERMDEVK